MNCTIALLVHYKKCAADFLCHIQQLSRTIIESLFILHRFVRTYSKSRENVLILPFDMKIQAKVLYTLR